MPKIKNAKILILATDGFEQSELEVPRDKLKAVAQLVHVAAPKERKDKDAITGWQGKDWASLFRSMPNLVRFLRTFTMPSCCPAVR